MEILGFNWTISIVSGLMEAAAAMSQTKMKGFLSKSEYVARTESGVH